MEKSIIRFYNNNTGAQLILQNVSELYIGETYTDVTHIAFDPEEGFYNCITTIPHDIYPNYEFIY